MSETSEREPVRPSSDNPQDKLFSSLREATKRHHHMIDHNPLLAPLVRPGLSLPAYGNILRILADFHVPLHAAFSEALERFHPDRVWNPGDRPGWLSADLGKLPPPDEQNPSVKPAVFGPFSSPAVLAGALYVAEGSSMGGRVIAEQLRSSLGLGPGNGARFFHGHGAETMARWGEFRVFASASCPPESVDEACSSAVRLFSDLMLFLDSRSAPADASGHNTTQAPSGDM